MRLTSLASKLIILTIFIASQSLAVEPLSLNCSISSTDYLGLKNENHFFDVVLSDHKHKESGHTLLWEQKGKQFWVMAHGVQRLVNREFINSYQLAVKDSASGLFVHALSDVSNNPSVKPASARLSLVDYHTDTFLERGELMFECHSEP